MQVAHGLGLLSVFCSDLNLDGRASLMDPKSCRALRPDPRCSQQNSHSPSCPSACCHLGPGFPMSLSVTFPNEGSPASWWAAWIHAGWEVEGSLWEVAGRPGEWSGQEKQMCCSIRQGRGSGDSSEFPVPQCRLRPCLWRGTRFGD